ncbi:O-antigen ligase family protein [Schlesneria paludicola]|uniref:O-antigen ligase family protein n=1 Tax=Schlesneria paludicola TaxID=360056 RepID=UPI00029A5709|nr:O-antigen ligase family protein [Schlesneria paludicola]
MRTVLLWIAGTFVVWPIHSTAATVGDKPIELMLSDVLCLLVPFLYLFARTPQPKSIAKNTKQVVHGDRLTPLIAIVFIAYATTLAGIGMGMTGEMIRLYSAFKLVKPIGFVVLGLLLGIWIDPFEFIKTIGWVFGVVSAMTMCCTITSPEFPAGEWGRSIYEWDLSGYPNSPMSFYAAMVPLLLAAAESSRHRFLPLLGWCLAGGTALTILGSMSRSSTLVLLFGTIIYLITTGRTAVLAGCFVAIMVFSVIGFGLFSIAKDTAVVATLEERVQQRLERSTESEDPSSGRFDIWQLALELAVEKPVFGYMFESFSRYSEFDTPHQQYLEVLHKCGTLGLMLYLALLVSGLSTIIRLKRRARSESEPWYLLRGMQGMIVGLMIGNLTQPNLTFSLTGNLVFLLFGCLSSSRAVITAGRPRLSTQNLLPQSKKPMPRPIGRVAA